MMDDDAEQPGSIAFDIIVEAIDLGYELGQGREPTFPSDTQVAALLRVARVRWEQRRRVATEKTPRLLRWLRNRGKV